MSLQEDVPLPGYCTFPGRAYYTATGRRHTRLVSSACCNGPHQAFEKILSSKAHITKGRDYKFLWPWLETGLLTSTGEKWHSRCLILILILILILVLILTLPLQGTSGKKNWNNYWLQENAKKRRGVQEAWARDPAAVGDLSTSGGALADNILENSGEFVAIKV